MPAQSSTDLLTNTPRLGPGRWCVGPLGSHIGFLEGESASPSASLRSRLRLAMTISSLGAERADEPKPAPFQKAVTRPKARRAWSL